MKTIYVISFLALLNSFSSYAAVPDYRLDPLKAMEGKWVLKGASCEKDGFVYRLSSDKKKQIFIPTKGYKSEAEILEVRGDKFLLIYDGEEELGSDGTLVKWWFLFDGVNTYRMRRHDWPNFGATIQSWIRC
ncbi:hypothetical protein [Pseudoalteromonas sp. T1lg48]|uniref:hypothetical protein n=1 Tax=Pseudoalteromonas sp. T1lg48 TaxID=2077100 RepID=UPI000CF6E5F4|nr:hypothetical protein [Pseudoalteromonas sp. T1lg48]